MALPPPRFNYVSAIFCSDIRPLETEIEEEIIFFFNFIQCFLKCMKKGRIRIL